MGVQKKLVKEGNGVDRPKKGDSVSMEYTGWLYDASRTDTGGRGAQFDSSVGRGDLTTEIGIGSVIKGWDDGILGTSSQPGMSLGEKCTLIISADFGYGGRGFPGLIPPNSPLIFDVELKAIKPKKAEGS